MINFFPLQEKRGKFRILVQLDEEREKEEESEIYASRVYLQVSKEVGPECLKWTPQK